MKFIALKGKVVIKLGKCQCTVDAEKALKAAHNLMAIAEKALRRAGRIHGE